MTNVVIQKGTPREKRDVTADKEWLEARVGRLNDKIGIFAERVKNARREVKERNKQLTNLK